jgi:hypothetical protein
MSAREDKSFGDSMSVCSITSVQREDPAGVEEVSGCTIIARARQLHAEWLV